MSKIERKFKELCTRGHKALVSYLMVGYPDYKTSLEAFRRVLEGGTDILEVGFPFSDPVADGPTIQLAHEVALKNGTKARDVFNLCRKIKEEYPDVPLLLMTYYNPIFRAGLREFSKVASESGLDGFIVPDLPPEESEKLQEAAGDYNLSLILLASPTSPERRLRLICEKSQGMIYFVSVTGTTGARTELPFDELRRNIERLKGICNKPVVVGFGVSNREHSARISKMADGVVVGSALVKLCGEKRLQELEDKVRELKEGTIIKN